MSDVTPANPAGDPEGTHEETPSPLRDPQVHEVVESLWTEQQAVFAERRRRGAPKFGADSDPEQFADMAYPLQGAG